MSGSGHRDEPRLFALILAAGGSSRLGRPKQLLEIGGETLIRRVLGLARAACQERVLLIIGHEWARVLEAAGGDVGFFAVNEDWASGLSGSLSLGIRGLPSDCDGVLVLLSDQPLVDRDDINTLADAWRAEPGRLVASRYAGTLGVPAIFPASYFGELTASQGDQGARAVIRRHWEDVIPIDCEHAALDIDDAGDLEDLRAVPGGQPD